jgi:hypothetical protein
MTSLLIHLTTFVVILAVVPTVWAMLENRLQTLAH